MQECSSEHPCGRCPQVTEQLQLVTERLEEVSRLRNIRSARGRLTWNCIRPSLRQAQQADKVHDTKDELSSLHPTEHSDLKESGQWQQIPAWHSRHIPSATPPPSQVSSCKRYNALQVEPNSNKDDSFSSLETLPRLDGPTTCIRTASIEKKRWITVIGNSLLNWTEGLLCRPDPLLRKVYCLPGAWLKEVKRKLPQITALRLLSIIDFLGRKWWACNRKSKGNPEDLGMTG